MRSGDLIAALADGVEWFAAIKIPLGEHVPLTSRVPIDKVERVGVKAFPVEWTRPDRKTRKMMTGVCLDDGTLIESRAIVSTWEEWESSRRQKLAQLELRDDDVREGRRIARGLGGGYSRNTLGPVVVLPLSRAKELLDKEIRRSDVK